MDDTECECTMMMRIELRASDLIGSCSVSCEVVASIPSLTISRSVLFSGE